MLKIARYSQGVLCNLSGPKASNGTEVSGWNVGNTSLSLNSSHAGCTPSLEWLQSVRCILHIATDHSYSWCCKCCSRQNCTLCFCCFWHGCYPPWGESVRNAAFEDSLRLAQFFEVYNAQADAASVLWNDLVVVCQNLLTRQLCQQTLSQGVHFLFKEIITSPHKQVEVELAVTVSLYACKHDNSQVCSSWQEVHSTSPWLCACLPCQYLFAVD